MLRSLVIAVSLAVSLAACSIDPSKPTQVCSAWGETTYNGRGGNYTPCVRYRLACIEPLILDEKPDGTLYCRMRREGDPS